MSRTAAAIGPVDLDPGWFHSTREHGPANVVYNFDLVGEVGLLVYLKDDSSGGGGHPVLREATWDADHVERSESIRHRGYTVVSRGVTEPVSKIQPLRTTPEPLGPVTGMSTVKREPNLSTVPGVGVFSMTPRRSWAVRLSAWSD